MSKRAEQQALEVYPITPGKIDDYEAERDAYTYGYEQAEKDINKELMDMMADVREKQEKAIYADYDIHIDTSNISDTSLSYVFKGDKVIDLLTWEDISIICQAFVDVNYEFDYHSLQEKYEEILRRFKKAKEEKK